MNPLVTTLAALAPPEVGQDHRPLAAVVAALRPRDPRDREGARAAILALLHVLDEDPALAEGARRYLGALLAAKRIRRLFDEVGIQPEDGFFLEGWRRLLHRALPPLADLRDFRDVVGAVFSDRRDTLWVDAVEDEVWAALFARLAPVFPGPVDAVRTRNELLDALSVLTHRIAAGGLDPALVRIHPALDEYESPFMAQSAEAHAFIASEKRRAEGEEAELVDDRHLLVLLRQCDEVLLRIRKCAHATGATVGLTYKLQRLRDLIDRTRALLAIVTPTEEADARRLAAVRLFKELVRADAQRNDLAPFVARNTQLLAEQVTAHAGRTGEHYITTTRAEYAAMFRGAAGAGVLVGLAAHAKIVLQARHFAPLVQATLIGLTYVTAFIGVQLLGFTIATKQPAMTAAALAAAIDETAPGKHRLSELTEMVVRLVRSQLVAVVGNVVVAFPVALLVSLLVLRLTGAPAVTDEKAAHLLADHYPLKSMALPHAAIAGLWLFLAGLVAGYFDNAAVYHRLPERIAQAPKVRFVLGPRLAARLGRYLGRGLGALAGNASFGLLLGYTAFVGVILGLPIDIRHVSFASANLAITLHAHHFDVPARALAAVAGGIVLIGVINVAVSFTLSLLLAFHARRATVRDAGTLVANVARRFYGRPLDFVYPPADAPDPTPPEPVG